MFLIPALIAAACDWVILVLSDKFPDHHIDDWYFSYAYLPYVAATRLLTLFPLSYHTSTGTRLKFPYAYYILHFITGTVMLIQMLQLGLSSNNPDSAWFRPILAPGPVILPPTTTTTTSDHQYRSLPVRFLREVHELVVSTDYTTIHETHRSTTASSNSSNSGVVNDSNQLKMIWILLTLSVTSLALHVLILLHVRSSAPPPTQSTRYRDLHNKKSLAYFVIARFNQTQKVPTTTNSQTANASIASSGGAIANFLLQNKNNMDPELSSLLSDNSHHGDLNNDANAEEKKVSSNGFYANTPQRNSSFTTSFMNNMDEFMAELQMRFDDAKRQWGLRLDEVHTRIVMQQNQKSNNPLTPFRALLSLYAYEEVFANHYLDNAFRSEHALTFYAPQLLSFLLHGAFLNSIELESWILNKCNTNLHFAHQCYWFLKAWCCLGMIEIDLENGNNHNDTSDNMPTRRISSEPDLRSGSSPLLLTDSNRASTTENHPKFGVEEHIVIERLVLKIMELGSDAAVQLDHSGNSAGESNLLQLPTDDNHDGYIPVDPVTGLPSEKHLLAATNFNSCLDGNGFQLSTTPSNERNSLEKSQLFLQTPNFLDSLLKIADDLFTQPRSKRTNSLREQLRELERQQLPSNVIYVPVNNSMHRVRRIVASESIAISTKERVPCIVCLEVIDYNSSSDNELTNWYKAPRPPQRHTTLFHKLNMTAFKRLRPEQQLMWKDIFGSSENTLIGTEMVPPKRENNNIAEDQKPRIIVAEKKFSGPGLPRPSSPPKQAASRTSEKNSLLLTSSSPASSCTSSRASSPIPSMGQWCSVASNDNQYLDDEELQHRIKKPRTQAMTDRQSSLILVDTDDEDADSVMSSSNSNNEGIKKRAVLSSPNPDLSLSKHYGATTKPESSDDLSTSNSAFKLEDSRDSFTNNEKDEEQGISPGKKKKMPPMKAKKRPPVVFKEDWKSKEERIRIKSAFGKHPKWRLLPVLVKSNDDLRQEQLASQLIHQMGIILAQAKSPAWLYPYEIIAITDNGGIMEAIPDTISIDSLKRNDKNFTTLKDFFERHFGSPGCDEHANAKANFVESLAAYSIVCFLLQVKDRHNGNILLDNKGHLIHIDFGFFFLSSPGKNSGFESAPFKLTRDFVDLMDGPDSATFRKFREICYKTFLELRKNCYQIIILVEMLMEGNEDLNCFRGRPQDAVRGLQERFRLDLNDRACMEYVNSLINESLENWRTRWYDRYQRFCVGVM